MVIIIYNQKQFVRRRLRRCHLRHKIRAIKARPNNPLRFLQRKNSIRRYLANDLTCAARKTTFRTQKHFHNKQYTPKSKVQSHGSARTHFDTGFNNGNFAMHRPTINFLLSHKITTVQQKNNQPEQSIISNNHDKQSPQPLNQKQPQQTTHTTTQSKTTKDNHNKQLRKNAMFLNIIISPTATSSEPTANTLFIKTQYYRTRKKTYYTLR